MKKKHLWLIVGIIALSISIIFVNAEWGDNPVYMWHSADNVKVITEEGEFSLQELFESGYFAPPPVDNDGSLSGNIKKIAFTKGGSGGTTCVLLTDGTVRCTGRNDYGQLGLGDSNHRSTFTVVSSLLATEPTDPHVSDITASRLSFCALLSDTTVKCWGHNDRGHLGVGDTIVRRVPTTVETSAGVPLIGVEKVIMRQSNDDEFVCALTNDGDVYCWGYNGQGQLGLGDITHRSYATKIDDLGADDVVELRIGGHDSGGYACARLSVGTVKCWGYNGKGQLGVGDRDRRLVPTTVQDDEGPLSDVTGIELAQSDYGPTCAIISDDTVKCWGYNNYGQAGQGSSQRSDQVKAVGVSGLSGITKIKIVGTSAQTTLCALSSNAEVYCWGYNKYGQVGDGTRITAYNPTRISLSDISDIDGYGFRFVSGSSSYGGSYFCALSTDGDVYCWGYNYKGQLGLGDTLLRSSPTKVSTIVGVKDIVTGGQGRTGYTCSILQVGGYAKCWGYNAYGGLGTGDKLDSLFPISPK